MFFMRYGISLSTGATNCLKKHPSCSWISMQVKNDLETFVKGNYIFSPWLLLSDGTLPTSAISDSNTPLMVLFLPYYVIQEYYHVMSCSSLLPLEGEEILF